MYQSVKDLVRTAEIQQKALSELVIEAECHESGSNRKEVWQRMRSNLLTMRAAIKQGENELGVRSKTGLTGGEAIKLKKYRAERKTLSGDVMMAAVENAIATNEVNAAMGVICATPTAGSSGTLPGALFMLEKRLGLSDSLLIYCWWVGLNYCQSCGNCWRDRWLPRRSWFSIGNGCRGGC